MFPFHHRVVWRIIVINDYLKKYFTIFLELLSQYWSQCLHSPLSSYESHRVNNWSRPCNKSNKTYHQFFIPALELDQRGKQLFQLISTSNKIRKQLPRWFIYYFHFLSFSVLYEFEKWNFTSCFFIKEVIIIFFFVIVKSNFCVLLENGQGDPAAVPLGARI